MPSAPGDPSLKGTYIGVMIVEAVIIVLLWLFSRAY